MFTFMIIYTNHVKCNKEQILKGLKKTVTLKGGPSQLFLAYPLRKMSHVPMVSGSIPVQMLNYLAYLCKTQKIIFPSQPRGVWLEAHLVVLMGRWPRSTGHAIHCPPTESYFVYPVHNVRPRAGRNVWKEQCETWTALELKTSLWKESVYTPLKNII